MQQPFDLPNLYGSAHHPFLGVTTSAVDYNCGAYELQVRQKLVALASELGIPPSRSYHREPLHLRNVSVISPSYLATYFDSVCSFIV